MTSGNVWMGKRFRIELCRKGDKGHGLEKKRCTLHYVYHPTESVNFMFGFLPFGDMKLTTENSTCIKVCKRACQNENETGKPVDCSDDVPEHRKHTNINIKSIRHYRMYY